MSRDRALFLYTHLQQVALQPASSARLAMQLCRHAPCFGKNSGDEDRQTPSIIENVSIHVCPHLHSTVPHSIPAATVRAYQG